MRAEVVRSWDGGFTLIELLITMTVISVLAAVTVPVVSQQLSRAHAARMAVDLASIETALTTFYLDVRSGYPGHLEQLTTRPIPGATGHSVLGGGHFTAADAARWSGPYLDTPLHEADADFDVVDATGSGEGMLNGLTCYDPEGNLDLGDACRSETPFVAVRVAGLGPEEFARVDALIDSTVDTGEGELRYDPALGVAYFLAVPYFP